MLDGLLLRRVGVDGRHAAELLGPGDLLRPWQHDPAIDARARVDVARGGAARCAVLDPRWTARAAAWPQLGAELAGRALARSLRLVMAMAIAQQPRLDVRLWMLFWDLADRYGKVHADGVHLELPLTHEVLSHLAGARRPSVSGALTRLADEGRLRRSGREWILSGDPPVLNGELGPIPPRRSARAGRTGGGQRQVALLASRRGSFNGPSGSLGRRAGQRRGALRNRYRA